MRWRSRTWHLGTRAARAAMARLAAAGHAGAACSTRPDGGSELVLWVRGAIPPDAAAILAELGAVAVDEAVHDEAVLMAAISPDGPVDLAPGVVIAPSAGAAARGSIRLHIPPAPAFGDGRHPSTRLAARALLGFDLAGCRALDLGCGTGVLGLLARARGAARVDFADIDLGSVRATRTACRRNGLARPRVWQADLLDGVRGTGYDLLIGNLYADLCLRLLADPRLEAVLPAGRIVLSGIAHRRRPAVERALRAAGFAEIARAQEAWWWSLSARRPARSRPG